ncbi:hypothetical protein [Natronorubrum sulfidifaciens]|uniref:DUF8108 domain-containing protein n=1 Tax=Natronorubrum sulfidifaciens JCM 14089 TaxID=1230460 RepID=L9WFX6_9EURY|nr:hypothetical protein [Natronorubrum sulfidifaciens]ELY48359.1 hypothetical protein C495_02765 [Natronorubrum sulfidifaciens JCM 14089]
MSDSTSGVVALADSVSDLLYGIAGWSLVVLGLMLAVTGGRVLLEFGLTTSAAVGATILFGLAFVTTAFGLFVNPRFRRRLERRHAPSKFGWVRSVDQRVIRPDERCSERCVACGSRIEQGMVRRYREEYAVAGVPVYTRSVGYNHYCLECATAELRGGEPSPSAVGTANEYETSKSEPSLERQ